MIVQVGVEPKRLLKILDNHEIASVISNMTLAEGFSIYAVDSKTKMICGSSDKGMLGEKSSSLYGGKLDKLNHNSQDKLFIYKEKAFFCKCRIIKDYIVIVSYDTSSSMVYFVLPIAIITLYLLVAGMVILGLFAHLHQTEEDNKEEIQNNYNEIVALNNTLKENNETISRQYEVLHSIAEVFYSAHFIDLENNIVTSLNEQGKVAEIIGKSGDAEAMMNEIMENTIVESYMEQAKEFSNLSTVAERMKGKKMISKELLGLNIGWFVASFIAVETDENDCPTKVVFTTRWIDDEKKKQEKLLKMSNMDELTGFYNRRGYDEAIKNYENDELDDNFVYVSIDVNGLKHVNDTFGHAEGDALIIGACECIKRSIGSYGRLYRTGGDEFIGLLEVDDKDIEHLMEKLHNETNLWGDGVVNELSVSVGYVTRKEDKNLSLHEMAIEADKRMYEAKALYYRMKGIDRRR